jgi:hypothetical protein
VRSGQASIELLIVLGVVVAIFILLGHLVYQTHVRSNDLKTYISGVRLANHIASEFNSLNAVGDGHYTSLNLPARMHGELPYTVSFFENESTVHITGGFFATGDNLSYTSPVSTSGLYCLIDECFNTCNRSRHETCLRVQDNMRVRMAGFDGGLYLTGDNNVIQEGEGFDIMPYYGSGDLPNPAPYVFDAGEKYGVIFLYRDYEEEGIGVYFAFNVSQQSTPEITVNRVMGEVAGVDSVEEGDFSLEGGRWEQDGDGSKHGLGVIRFRGGFSLCVTPISLQAYEWTFLSADSEHQILSNDREVCVYYP